VCVCVCVCVPVRAASMWMCLLWQAGITWFLEHVRRVFKFLQFGRVVIDVIDVCWNSFSLEELL